MINTLAIIYYKREEKAGWDGHFQEILIGITTGLGAGISPQYFLNRLHSYSGITISLFIYNNGSY